MRYFLTVALLGALPLISHAQNIAQGPDWGTLTIFAQNIDHRAVVFKDGSRPPGGRAYNRTISMELSAGITNRLSVTVGIPYVFGRYTDRVDLLPDPASPRDKCRCLKSDWQDFVLIARYNILDSRRWNVTPSISAGIPSHNYEFIGLNIPGRNLKELTLSTEVWRRLSKKTSLSGRYSYSFVEKALGKSTNRSNLVLQGDYTILRNKLDVFGLGVLQRTHGGLRATPRYADGAEFATEDQWLQRNRLFRDNHFRAGGGVSYSLGRMQVLGTMVFHVTGRNTHTENILTLAVRYPFNWRPDNRPSNR